MILVLLKILQVKKFDKFFLVQKNLDTKNVFWTNKKLPNAARQGACDVVLRTPQPLILLSLASGIDSINDALKILFPDQMVQLIVGKTNTKIQHVNDNFPAYYNKSDKKYFCSPS